MKTQAMDYNHDPSSSSNVMFFTFGAILGVLKMVYNFYAATPLLAETFGSALFKTGITMFVGGVAAVLGKSVGVVILKLWKSKFSKKAQKDKDEKVD